MPLQPVLLDFPFSKWGLEFIGPMNPSSSTIHIFILIATYYFTKRTEVVPLKHAQNEKIISFLETNIFSHFVFSIEIVYDNGPTFIYENFT